MANGLEGLAPNLWQKVRRVLEPQSGAETAGLIGASMMPGVGEAIDIADIAAGIEDRNLGRIALGAAGLALPFVTGRSIRGIRDLARAGRSGSSWLDRIDLAQQREVLHHRNRIGGAETAMKLKGNLYRNRATPDLLAVMKGANPKYGLTDRLVGTNIGEKLFGPQARWRPEDVRDPRARHRRSVEKSLEEARRTGTWHGGFEEMFDPRQLRAGLTAEQFRRQGISKHAVGPFRQWLRNRRAQAQGYDPEVLWHATDRADPKNIGVTPPFREFEVDPKVLAERGTTDPGWYGTGAYFTPDPAWARQFGDQMEPYYTRAKTWESPYAHVNDLPRGSTDTVHKMLADSPVMGATMTDNLINHTLGDPKLRQHFITMRQDMINTWVDELSGVEPLEWTEFGKRNVRFPNKPPRSRLEKIATDRFNEEHPTLTMATIIDGPSSGRGMPTAEGAKRYVSTHMNSMMEAAEGKADPVAVIKRKQKFIEELANLEEIHGKARAKATRKVFDKLGPEPKMDDFDDYAEGLKAITAHRKAAEEMFDALLGFPPQVKRGLSLEELSSLAIRDAILESGYQAGRFANELVVYDPSTIRHAAAGFDPSKMGSSDVLAGIAGLSATAAVRNAMQDQRRGDN